MIVLALNTRDGHEKRAIDSLYFFQSPPTVLVLDLKLMCTHILVTTIIKFTRFQSF